jgi:DNA-binding PadR family transcriptional regulator
MDALQRVTAPTMDVLEQLVAEGAPLWGLIIIKRTGRAPGTVYPILDRLERLGWVSSAWDDDELRAGPRRRLYRLTGEALPAARDLLAQRRSTTVAVARQVHA